MSMPEAIRRAHLQAIIENPEDNVPRLVFADRLDEYDEAEVCPACLGRCKFTVKQRFSETVLVVTTKTDDGAPSKTEWSEVVCPECNGRGSTPGPLGRQAQFIRMQCKPEKPREKLNRTVGMGGSLVKFLEEQHGFQRNNHPLANDPNEWRDIDAEMAWLANNRGALRNEYECIPRHFSQGFSRYTELERGLGRPQPEAQILFDRGLPHSVQCDINDWLTGLGERLCQKTPIQHVRAFNEPLTSRVLGPGEAAWFLHVGDDSQESWPYYLPREIFRLLNRRGTTLTSSADAVVYRSPEAAYDDLSFALLIRYRPQLDPRRIEVPYNPGTYLTSERSDHAWQVTIPVGDPAFTKALGWVPGWAVDIEFRKPQGERDVLTDTTLLSLNRLVDDLGDVSHIVLEGRGGDVHYNQEVKE